MSKEDKRFRTDMSRQLQKNEFYEMPNLEKREKDRKFGQFVKKSLKDLKKLNHKF